MRFYWSRADIKFHGFSKRIFKHLDRKPRKHTFVDTQGSAIGADLCAGGLRALSCDQAFFWQLSYLIAFSFFLPSAPELSPSAASPAAALLSA